MAKALHTPGPWYQGSDAYPIGILSAHRHGEGDPEQICLIGGDIMAPESPEECEANARLICAAPRMRAAAEAVDRMLAEIIGDLDTQLLRPRQLPILEHVELRSRLYHLRSLAYEARRMVRGEEDPDA